MGTDCKGLYKRNKTMSGRKLINNTEKWPGYVSTISDWWESLTYEEKIAAKKHYEEVRVWSASRKRFVYPSIHDTEEIRVNKLSPKQLYRIWCFRGHKIEK